MIWSEFYTDAWFVFDGAHVPPRIQKSMFLLYKVLAKNLIVIFSNKSRWGRISGVKKKKVAHHAEVDTSFHSLKWLGKFLSPSVGRQG